MRLFKSKNKKIKIKDIDNIIFLMGVAIFSITILALIYGMFAKKSEFLFYKDRIDFQQIFRFASPLFYFTSLSNLALGAALWLFGWNFYSKKTFYFNFLFIATAWISITFLVYWGLLFWIGLKAGVNFKLFQSFISVLVHGIHPLAGFWTLYLIRGKFKVETKAIFTGMFLFSAYGMFSLVLYISVFLVKGQPTIIYPFLDFTRPFLYAGGNIYLIILLDAILFGLLFAAPFFTSLALLKIFKIGKIDPHKKIQKPFQKKSF